MTSSEVNSRNNGYRGSELAPGEMGGTTGGNEREREELRGGELGRTGAVTMDTEDLYGCRE